MSSLTKSIYIIGSLRNRDAVIQLANKLRDNGLEGFDDWLSPGEEADDKWKEYEEARGRTYLDALKGWAARHVFEFDKFHLDRCDGAVLICPSGKSCHLEAGYMIGQGKPVYVLLDTPDRWDVMYQFATGIYTDEDVMIKDIIIWQP